MTIALSRRGLLGGIGTGLVLGLLPGGTLAAPNSGQPVKLQQWLRIDSDGTATLFSNAQEMGQGGFSGMAQLLADELCLPWDKVRVETAPLDPALGMSAGTTHWTGGSSTIRTQWDKLRRAAAAAREMLVTAGAASLNVPVDECRAMEGHVQHAPSGRRVAYAAIVEQAARLPVPQAPQPLPASARTLVGRPVLRKDIPAKTDGSTRYAVDVRLPGLLSATLMQCPVFGGKLRSVDPAPALRVPGVRRVIALQGISFAVPGQQDPLVLADAVAVLADHWWAARQGLLALSPDWDMAGQGDLDTGGMYAVLDAKLSDPGSIRMGPSEVEDEIRAAHAAGLGKAVQHFSRDYRVPALAHAQMEPLSAVVDLRPGRAEAWTGSQFPTGVARILSALSGLAEDKVTVNVLCSGGGFGRRYLNDYVAYAAFLSRQAAAPVKLIYSREEDLSQGRYRPATAARISAGLDRDGRPTAVRTHCVPASGNVWISMAVPGTATQPDHQPSYYLPAPLTTMADGGLPVPNGPWRAPGSTQGAFFFESFVDELAHHLGRDPVAYRRWLLDDNPRARRVLDAAVAAAGWGRVLPPGHGLGVAIWNSFQSIAAQVVEVVVTDDRLRVVKVWCAFDCGTVVNPDSARAQGEGSILMALSASLAEKVELDKGAVTSRNFDRYSLIHLDQVPAIEIILLDSPEAPVGGVGEPMTPPLPPALVNAVFAATGRRLRSLPLSDHGFQMET